MGPALQCQLQDQMALEINMVIIILDRLAGIIPGANSHQGRKGGVLRVHGEVELKTVGIIL